MRERAVIYARYSSEKQTEQSIEGQLRVCKEYAEKNNLNIVGTYIDRAKTGKNDNREGFQNMLKDSANKSFSIVLVYALDRFARNRYDSAMNKSVLKKNGVKLISATQPISENPEGILLESLLEGMAEYYSAELAQKVERGRRESIEKGQYIGGVITYGYSVENKRFVINQSEAEIVKLVFGLFLQKYSYTEILDYLKDKHILNRNGTFFKKHQLKNMLCNQAYIGILRSGNLVNETAMPTIIPKEEFMEVQNLMTISYKRQSVANENFLLAGKMVCGECGANMVGDSGTSKYNKTYYYYSCNNHKNNKCCDLERFPKEKLEQFIADKIRENLDKDYFNTILVDIQNVIANSSHEKEIANLKKELQSVERKIKNITNAVINGFLNDDIKKQNQELLEQKSDIETKLQEKESVSFAHLTPDKIEKFVKKHLTKSNETILKVILNKAIIYKDKMIIIMNMPDDNTKKIELDITKLGKKFATVSPKSTKKQHFCAVFLIFFKLFNCVFAIFA